MGSKRRYVKVNEEKEDTEEKEENSIKWVLFNFMNNKVKTYMIIRIIIIYSVSVKYNKIKVFQPLYIYIAYK